jgi:hypothetical protein
MQRGPFTTCTSINRRRRGYIGSLVQAKETNEQPSHSSYQHDRCHSHFWAKYTCMDSTTTGTVAHRAIQVRHGPEDHNSTRMGATQSKSSSETISSNRSSSKQNSMPRCHSTKLYSKLDEAGRIGVLVHPLIRAVLEAQG